MTDTNYYEKIGPHIKKLREEKGLTKSQLASGICSVSYISRVEKGERCPSSIILRQITTKLGTSPEELFRYLESPDSLNTYDLINELYVLIQRHNFVEMNEMLLDKEKEIDTLSLRDAQIIKLFRCICDSILLEKYDWGIEESKKILALTNPDMENLSDIEFSLFFIQGWFLLFKDENQKAYDKLIEIKDSINNIKHFHHPVILSRFYILIALACIDLKKQDEASVYIETGINYCKDNNLASHLRELYLLKGELYYQLGDKQNFTLWKQKAFDLHELIKDSDNELFEIYANERLKKLK